MKKTIYIMIVLFISNVLNAFDVSIEEHIKQISKVNYELSVTNHSFAKEDSLMPGVTLRLKHQSVENTDIEFTYARTLPEYDMNIADEALQEDLVQTAFYTKLTYKF